MTTQRERFRMTRLETLRWLINTFDEITAYPSETGGEDPDADARRESQLALIAFVQFMQEVPGLTGKEAPLLALLSALVDVQEGGNPKLFKKPKSKRKRGKPKPALGVQFLRARAAAAMEFFFRADPAARPDATKAAQRVANGCARWFDERPTAKQVKTWRSDFKAGGNDDGAQYYKVTIASLENQFPDPEQAAQAALYLLST